jgi:hypothetical protein
VTEIIVKNGCALQVTAELLQGDPAGLIARYCDQKPPTLLVCVVGPAPVIYSRQHFFTLNASIFNKKKHVVRINSIHSAPADEFIETLHTHVFVAT